MKTIIALAISKLMIFLMFATPAFAGEHILQPKLGIVDWSDNGPHSVKGNSFTLDSDASGSAGFMYLYRLDNGFAFGGELYGYTKDYTHSNGNKGEAEIGHIYGLAEYYFNNDGAIKPFIGIGLGGAGMEFSGEINHSTSGGSVQIKGGLEFGLSERFALTTEAKYFTIDMDEDDNGQNLDIKSKGYGLFVGFTIKI